MLKSISRAALLPGWALAHSCSRGGSHGRVIHHDQDSTPERGHNSVLHALSMAAGTQRSPAAMDNAEGQVVPPQEGGLQQRGQARVSARQE